MQNFYCQDLISQSYISKGCTILVAIHVCGMDSIKIKEKKIEKLQETYIQLEIRKLESIVFLNNKMLTNTRSVVTVITVFVSRNVCHMPQ